MNLHRLTATTFFTALATLAHAEPSMLHITTDPGETQIFVDGRRWGTSPSQEWPTFVVNGSLQTVSLSLEKVNLPAKPYDQAPNGSVTVAGREWLRCSLGQSWSGNNCSGQAKEYKFEEAKSAANAFNTTGYGGKRDWRLPTVRELASLRECSTGFGRETIDIEDGGKAVSEVCNDKASLPTINNGLFPQTPYAYFWTVSSSVSTPYLAWIVDFYDGRVYYSSRNVKGYVRLVR